ncbi:MAG: hypothetical protein KUA35_11340 [Pseudodesulfovibrio sp.]|nr:asparagine synthase-related protein [Pseudodesulfovibrio aespoeensis]MBU4378828.1 TIGR00268 family protein [Pseudomonadota bacterium]MBU4476424.1 TIGR00268 family protein [Pseudomonadota bacterium]MBV1773004.1 hypothetical protein [Pseudodesulfovibrio sp.]MCG2731636.1 asparagine synthase-related protein [Pseudodesulfovibrio aespoeensis]
MGSRLTPAGLLVVALSGGVDSGLVAAAAHAAGTGPASGGRVVAVTVCSELSAGRDVERASAVARHIGLAHGTLTARLLENEAVRRNNADRCYHCKRAIFDLMRREFGQECLLVDGTNADDDPARPGLRAAQEYGVFHPLKELAIPKVRVRELARGLGLPNWDTPSESCLATRLPQGLALTQARLDKVRAMEDFLRERGVKTLRARHDDMVATVEYPAQYAGIIAQERDSLADMIKGIGLGSCQFKEWTE